MTNLTTSLTRRTFQALQYRCRAVSHCSDLGAIKSQLAVSRDRIVAVAMLAILFACMPGSARAQFGAANCPEARDSAVEVQVGRATLIRLPVVSPDGARVSIFQPPTGGVLEAIGNDGLEFVFIADDTFAGISELTYRVRPPVDCADNVLLGRVKLVGTPGVMAVVEDDAAPFIFEPQTIRPTVCGLGASAPLLLMCWMLSGRRRRSDPSLKS